MSSFTQFNPGSVLEIRQIHNKAKAVEGKIYWGRSADGTVHQYRGTHEGRLKDETNLVELTETVDNISGSDVSKCFVIAMSVALG